MPNGAVKMVLCEGERERRDRGMTEKKGESAESCGI